MKSNFLLFISMIMFIHANGNEANVQDSLACHMFCCCINDPAPAGIMGTHVHDRNEWMVSYRYMRMNMEGNMQGTDDIDKAVIFEDYLMAPDRMSMDMHMLMLMYGITDRLTVMAMAEYVRNRMEMSMLTTGAHQHGTESMTSGEHEMESSGISDTKITALYALQKKSNNQFVVSAGVSLPTGDIGLKDPLSSSGRRLPYMMQTGSGTFDLLAGLSYMYQNEKYATGSQLSSVFRPGENANGYTSGNEFAFNSWFAWQWTKSISTSARLEAILSDDISGIDPTLYRFSEPSAHPANYGGESLSCAVGAIYQFKHGFFINQRLGAEYSIPVLRRVNGIQMKQQSTLNLLWSISF